jgi:hypothetical protein
MNKHNNISDVDGNDTEHVTTLLKHSIHEIKNIKLLTNDALNSINISFQKEELLQIIYAYNDMIDYVSSILNEK